jgi:hypothetical protein
MFKELQFIDAIVIFGKRAILKIRSEPSREALLVVITEEQPRLLSLAFLASGGGVARVARGQGGGAGGLTYRATKGALPSGVSVILHEVRQGG